VAIKKWLITISCSTLNKLGQPLCKRSPVSCLLCTLALVSIWLAGCASRAQTHVEIFSSWTTGPEAVGLQKLSDQFHAQHPDAQIINASLGVPGTPGAGEDLRARMLAGNPPDSFQARMGEGFRNSWVVAGSVEPLDDLYRDNGLSAVFPQAILDLVSYQGRQYAVPINIHRANVLFYNRSVFQANGIDPSSLQTFSGWEAGAEALKAAGITPLALGDSDPSTSAQLLETVLIGTLGPEGYRRLWTGASDWSGAGVTRALENFRMMLGYVNPDHAALTWDQANQLVIDGKVAMIIMTDWVDSDYIAKGFSGYGWTSPPGNAGVFDVLGDSFGLPVGAKHPELAKGFLSVLASKQGQESFSRTQGAICARSDCDLSSLDPYLQSSAAAWKTDAIVPSAVQGAAISPRWSEAFIGAAGGFVKTGDLAATQEALAQACRSAGMCK